MEVREWFSKSTTHTIKEWVSTSNISVSVLVSLTPTKTNSGHWSEVTGRRAVYYLPKGVWVDGTDSHEGRDQSRFVILHHRWKLSHDYRAICLILVIGKNLKAVTGVAEVQCSQDRSSLIRELRQTWNVRYYCACRVHFSVNVLIFSGFMAALNHSVLLSARWLSLQTLDLCWKLSGS